MRTGIISDRNFLLYTAGNAVAWTGMWMQRTGLGWLSWELTHSPSWVGVIALAQYVPLVVFGPIFGVILDRADRRRYAIAIQLVMLALGVALCVVERLEVLSIYVLLGFCLLLGFANSGYQTVRLTLVHDVVPRALLTQAIGANSVVFNTTRLIGPALGGVSIAWLGIGFTFLLCAATCLASVAALLAISIRSSERQAQTGGLVAQFTEGLRYTLASQTVRELLLLSLITSMLARGVLELMPAFAGGEFDGGSSALAMLMAAGGAGAMVAGYLLSRSREDNLNALVRHGCTWSGVAVSVFSIVGYYPAAVVVAVILGTLVTLSSVGLQAILQSKIDNDYRGRVIGFWGIANIAGPAVGGALLGGIAHVSSLRTVTFLSGLLCALLCFVLMRRRSSGFSRQ
jgi:MFS family permease